LLLPLVQLGIAQGGGEKVGDGAQRVELRALEQAAGAGTKGADGAARALQGDDEGLTGLDLYGRRADLAQEPAGAGRRADRERVDELPIVVGHRDAEAVEL